MIPTKKISLTLLEYAEPLLTNLEDGYSQSHLEEVLKLETCSWNACVLDQWHSSTGHVEAVRRQISKAGNSLPAAIVEAMIERKSQYFWNDKRGIKN